MSAMQRESKKTYVEMGESDMLLIEAYCYGFGLNAKQAQDYIDWPWQSISAHLKVMDDRIARKKDTIEHIQARANETIAKLGLTKPEIAPPKVKYAKKEEVEKLETIAWAEEVKAVPIITEHIVVTSEAPTDTISTQPPFYMLALDDLIHQLRSGAISFRSLFVDDERLELRYKRSTT